MRSTTAPRSEALKSLQCPKCGKKGEIYNSGQKYDGGLYARNPGATGQPRYRCGGKPAWIKQGRGCGWNGTKPIGLERVLSDGIDHNEVTKLYEQLRSSTLKGRFVITSAQNATPVWTPFWETLKHYCSVNDAQLIVIPYRYKNPTSMWTENAKNDDWWAKEVKPFLLNKRLKMHKYLTLLGDVMTQPTASSPLSEFETLTGASSAIIGHPKLELVTVPTPQSKLPKLLTTTGACTKRNYIPGKAGKKGEHHHTFGAAVVEIGDGLFHIRQINSTRQGTFCDLDREYGPDWDKPVKAAALVMGDTHVRFVSPEVTSATFGKNGIVDILKPDYLVWHDVLDGHTFNHHTRKDFFQNLAKYKAKKHNVEAEIDECCAYIDKHSPGGVTNIIVDSNHPGWLSRWVNETDPRTDLENCVFLATTFVEMAKATKLGKHGTETPDPFEFWAKRKLKCAKRTMFPGPDGGYQIEGIEVGYHGDRGANGAKGTIRGFGKIGAKSVIGHRHTPGIKDGVYQVGTSSLLRLDYTHGPSSWLNTHCIIYRNGKRSLINIIEGKWRLK